LPAVAVAPAGYAASAEPHVPRLIGVGYDDTREARLALDFAVTIAEATGATLRLWCVVAPTGAEGAHHDRCADFTQYIHGIARRQLDHGRARVPAELRVTTKVMEGHAGEQIAREALREDVDLVVVGSRGHGPVASVLIGSTARKLMRTAACPVAVVPRPR
jgi:nucleotide-binding universal stress UspA family protein